MGLLNFFKTELEAKQYSQLYDKISRNYPKESEDTLVKMSCIAGLLARIAYADFKLDPMEREKIKTILSSELLGNDLNGEEISEMAIEHIKEMAGLENHLYIQPLRSLLSQDERFKLIQLLFAVAASDGEVEGCEVEDIRTIAKGLDLSSQHFLAARAEVAEFLKALKS